MKCIRQYSSTAVLSLALLVLGLASLFVGVIDMDLGGLLSGDPALWKVFLTSRIPRSSVPAQA